MAAGNKTVSVSYSGDDSYLENFTSGNFTVSKVESSVNVSVENIGVGDVAVIEITVPGDATGWVHVTVDGKTYGALVDGGKASIEVSGLSNGTHDSVVSYELMTSTCLIIAIRN